MPKFDRAKLIIGNDKFLQLQNANVIIFGIGAVGYQCLESLVRTGLKNITIVDFDTISESNFNRHILALDDNIDKLKIECAKERLLKINSNINLKIINKFGHTETFNNIIKDNHTLIIDAIDSLNPKVSLLEFAIKNNKKIISCMGAARRTDPTKIKIDDISKVNTCPLGKMVKKRLKKRGITTGFKVVFSDEQKNNKTIKDKEEKNSYERGRSRIPNGSLSMITSIFGSYLALLALETITKNKNY